MMQTYGTAMPIAQALAEMQALTYEKAARTYAKNNEGAVLPISIWADMWNQEHLKRSLDPIGEDHEPRKTHASMKTLPIDMQDHLYSVENLMALHGRRSGVPKDDQGPRKQLNDCTEEEEQPARGDPGIASPVWRQASVPSATASDPAKPRQCHVVREW